MLSTFRMSWRGVTVAPWFRNFVGRLAPAALCTTWPVLAHKRLETGLVCRMMHDSRQVAFVALRELVPNGTAFEVIAPVHDLPGFWPCIRAREGGTAPTQIASVPEGP